MKLQIQITEIENGYLVASQPRPNEIQQAQLRGEAPQPKVSYCETIGEVCDTIAAIEKQN